jgi:hypothetical protein
LIPSTKNKKRSIKNNSPSSNRLQLDALKSLNSIGLVSIGGYHLILFGFLNQDCPGRKVQVQRCKSATQGAGIGNPPISSI